MAWRHGGGGIWCGVCCKSLPCGPTGAALGTLPDLEAVERLGLAVFDGGEAPAAVAADILGETEKGVVSQDKGRTFDILSPGGAGRGKEEEYQPFLFSDGFPPVPAKLVGKILRLEFMDMAELLRDNIEAERRQGRQREATGVPAKQQQRREVPDILSWIQCLGYM